MVQTNYGKIEGVQMDGYTVYKGIPYAKPPVGELRWKAPQKPECWEGIYQADAFAKIPPQVLPEEGQPIMGRFKKEFYSNPEFLPEMSEDCQQELNNPPAYAYHFARRLPGDDWGSFHSAELWYTFGTLGRSWRPMEQLDYDLSEQ